MARHLTSSQIESVLNRQKSIECFLGSLQAGQISWLEIRPHQGAYELWQFDAFDDGSDNYLDVYSFDLVESDFVDPLRVFDDALSALDYAAEHHSASKERWVNQSVIQDEYADLLTTRK